MKKVLCLVILLFGLFKMYSSNERTNPLDYPNFTESIDMETMKHSTEPTVSTQDANAITYQTIHLSFHSSGAAIGSYVQGYVCFHDSEGENELQVYTFSWMRFTVSEEVPVENGMINFYADYLTFSETLGGGYLEISIDGGNTYTNFSQITPSGDASSCSGTYNIKDIVGRTIYFRVP